MTRRLLVVEDDPNTWTTSPRASSNWAGRSSATPTAATGSISRPRPFDAIVLDRNLPGMDGLSVLKALRAAQNKTPLIILSAIAHADERVRGCGPARTII